MRVRSVLGNGQWLDGGAMFGHCPRALWSRWVDVDERHRVELACRSLLVQDGHKTVLVEAGVGTFFRPALRERYGVLGEQHALLANLAALGVAPEAIDVVVLSHLHFDHAGGVLTPWQPETAPALLFPRASYVVSRGAWDRAVRPHQRDAASFIPELQPLLAATDRLELLDGPRSRLLGEDWEFVLSEGHTPGMLVPRLATPEGTVSFLADLVPGVPWLRGPLHMGYDRNGELLIDEKAAYLARIEAERGLAFFTHDVSVAACRLDGTLAADEDSLVSELAIG